MFCAWQAAVAGIARHFLFHVQAALPCPHMHTTTHHPLFSLQAQAAYDKMRTDGVQPNARFFTQLIRICGRANDLGVSVRR